MNHGTTSTLCGLTLLAAACASGRNGEPEAPPGFELVYAQDFEDPRAAQDFVASDPRAWRVAREGGNGFLELFAASRYQPPHRSPLAIAVLVGPVVGDFVLELDVQQTGREYDHRDLCFFFGVRDPAHYGYAHLATRADDTAHHVHLVEAADRRPVTSARTFGVDWGSARWRHVRLVREARSGRVRLGMIDVAAVVHYPAVLREFRLLHPDVDLTLSVAPSSALLDDLRAGRLDLVVCVEPPRGLAGVDVIAMRREPLCVMAPPGTVIAEPGRWGPWLTFPTGSHTRHLIVERLRELGAPLSIAAESHQPDVLREMVGIGLGWTVLPLDPSFQVGDLVVGPAILERDLVLARRSDSVHDPAADELAARLGEAAATTALVERGL